MGSVGNKQSCAVSRRDFPKTTGAFAGVIGLAPTLSAPFVTKVLAETETLTRDGGHLHLQTNETCSVVAARLPRPALMESRKRSRIWRKRRAEMGYRAKLDRTLVGQRRRSVPDDRSRGDPMFPKIPHRLWLLLLPYIGLLWVPFYNFSEPVLFGFPFFYWYQLAWVPV
jgi:hypothetical protein